MRANVGAIIAVGGENSPAYTWNEDIVMSSFYHPTATPPGAGAWCGALRNEVENGTPVTIAAGDGLTGKTKCSF